MSWSIIVEGIQSYQGFSQDDVARFASANLAYPQDALYALVLARNMGLKSATLSGARTPNPYGGDEVVNISIHGFANAVNFVETMKALVVEPEQEPDE